MKRCKKLLCLVLALVMALSLCTVAMADDPAVEITLSGYYYGGMANGISVEVKQTTIIDAVDSTSGANNYTKSLKYVNGSDEFDVSWIGADDATDDDGSGAYSLKIQFSEEIAGTLPTEASKYKLKVQKHTGDGTPLTEYYSEITATSCSEGAVVFELPLEKKGKTQEIKITKNVEQKGNVAPGETTFGLDIKCDHAQDDEGNYSNYYNLIKIDDSFTYTPGTSEYTIKVSGPKAVLEDFMLKQGFFVREKTHPDAAWDCDTTMWYVNEHAWGSTDNAGRLTCTVADAWGTVPKCLPEAGNNDVTHRTHFDAMTFTNVYTENVVVDEPINRQTVTPAPEAPATKPVASPKTGDMGVALYAAMALLSMSGSAVIIGKKRSK